MPTNEAAGGPRAYAGDWKWKVSRGRRDNAWLIDEEPRTSVSGSASLEGQNTTREAEVRNQPGAKRHRLNVQSSRRDSFTT